MKEHIEILLEDLDAVCLQKVDEGIFANGKLSGFAIIGKCQLFDVREIREWQISG